MKFRVVFFFIKYRYNDILLKNNNINFIYSIDRIMDLIRAEPTSCRINFPYVSFSKDALPKTTVYRWTDEFKKGICWF